MGKDCWSIVCKSSAVAIVIGAVLLAAAAARAAVDHSLFGELLARYNRDGWVDYAGLKSD